MILSLYINALMKFNSINLKKKNEVINLKLPWTNGIQW